LASSSTASASWKRPSRDRASISNELDVPRPTPRHVGYFQHLFGHGRAVDEAPGAVGQKRNHHRPQPQPFGDGETFLSVSAIGGLITPEEGHGGVHTVCEKTGQSRLGALETG
jgi:hypothetical protein